MDMLGDLLEQFGTAADGNLPDGILDSLLRRIRGSVEEHPLYTAAGDGFTVHLDGVVMGGAAQTGIRVLHDGSEKQHMLGGGCNPFALYRLAEALAQSDAAFLDDETGARALYEIMGAGEDADDDLFNVIPPRLSLKIPEIFQLPIPAEVVEFALEHRDACCRYHFTEEVERGTIEWDPRFAEAGILTVEEAEQLAAKRGETINSFLEDLADWQRYIWNTLPGEAPEGAIELAQLLGELVFGKLIVEVCERLPGHDYVTQLTVAMARMWDMAQGESHETGSGISPNKAIAVNIAVDWLTADNMVSSEDAPTLRVWAIQKLHQFDQLPVEQVLKYGKW